MNLTISKCVPYMCAMVFMKRCIAVTALCFKSVANQQGPKRSVGASDLGGRTHEMRGAFAISFPKQCMLTRNECRPDKVRRESACLVIDQ